MKRIAGGLMLPLLTAGILLAGALPARTAAGERNPTTGATAAGTNRLSLDFRDAPLDQVLDHLSAAAGFIINKQTEVRGTVQIWSKDPVTRDEAVQLLNSALRKNGYMAVRSGRILTITSVEDAKSSDLEVVHGGDPEAVEKSETMVTQVIPVRFASAGQLLSNLQPLLPSSASLTLNESANSLILVTTQTQVKRMLRIIAALDNAMARGTSIKVIPLQHADARQLATAVQQLFPIPSTTQAAAAGPGAGPQMFNFPGGPPGAGIPGEPGQSSRAVAAANNATAAKGLRVIAVADEASNSLILSAAEGIMPGLLDMVRQIDQPASAMTEVRAFRLKNADATELAEQLAILYPDNTRDSGRDESSRTFAGGPPGPDDGPAGFGPLGSFSSPEARESGSPSRVAKAARVLAVADPRTGSLLVSASGALMPQIARLVEKLDSSSAGKETVSVFDLSNADPLRVRQVLEDLFNRSLVPRSGAQSAAQDANADPLTSRQTQQPIDPSQDFNSFGAGGDAGGVGGGFGSADGP